MPSSKKARTLTIRVGLIPMLERRHEKALAQDPKTNPELGGYINDLLDDVIAKDDFLATYAPALSYAGHGGNVLYIKDDKRDKTAEIYRYGREIKCTLDDSFDCEHVHFALAIPEVARLGIGRR